MATTVLTQSRSTQRAHSARPQGDRNMAVAPRQRSSQASSSKSTSSDPITRLKALYQPAAKAFVRKDVLMTQSLVETAFQTLDSLPAPDPANEDPYGAQKRKWDLLRITLETTAYTGPLDKSLHASEALSSSLKDTLSKAPLALVESLYERSLKLYSPSQPPSAMFLPPSILSALVFSALKVDCAEAAKQIVEGWLSLRGQASSVVSAGGKVSPLVDLSLDAYDKVVEVYCLQILPRVGEWETAMGFLKYEPELPIERRKFIYTSLKTLHTQVHNPPAPTVTRSASSPSSEHSMSASDETSYSESQAEPSSAVTPRPGDFSHQPHRVSSALSSSSVSSISSQQTIRAPQQYSYSHPTPSPLHHQQSYQSSRPESRGSSRSPRRPTTRTDPASAAASVAVAAPNVPGSVDGSTASRSSDKPSRRTTTTTGTGTPGTSNSSPRSSQRGQTFSPLPRPPRPPGTDDADAGGNALGHSSSRRNEAARNKRPTPLEAVRAYYVSYAEKLSERLGVNLGAAGTAAPLIAFVLLSVLVPLVGFVARLRALSSSRGGSSAASARRAITAGASAGALVGASASSSLTAATARPSIGAARWLWQAVRDSVIMAGKGLV